MAKRGTVREMRDAVVVDFVEHPDGTWTRLHRYWGKRSGERRSGWCWVVGRGFQEDPETGYYDGCAKLGGNMCPDEASAREAFRKHCERLGVRTDRCPVEIDVARFWDRCEQQDASACEVAA